MNRLAIVVGLAACGHAATKPDPRGEPAMGPKLESNLPISSDDVTFTAGGRTIPGTFVHPTTGKRPTVVLMAGSGPTDRDWNSPLLEGKNGSAKLLAEELGHHGFAVLRFDKAGTGGNKIDLDKLTFDTYLEEGRGALAWARTQTTVDPAHLFIAGHSEGGIHATRVAQAEGKRIAGLMLLSAPGRSMQAVITSQLTEQFAAAVKAGAVDKATADKELAAVAGAFADFEAGKPVDASKVGSIPQVQQLVAQITFPGTAALSRPLFAFDPIATLQQVGVAVFIYNGMHDMQVDADVDAKQLAAAKPDATVFLAPEANHVMEHEPRDKVALRADFANLEKGYNAPDRVIDAASVDAIVHWLAKTSFAR